MSEEQKNRVITIISNVSAVVAAISWFAAGNLVLALAWSLAWVTVQFFLWQLRWKYTKLRQEILEFRNQVSQLNTQLEFRQEFVQPNQCYTCKFYYGRDNIVCAIAPYGPQEGEVCKDWQERA